MKNVKLYAILAGAAVVLGLVVYFVLKNRKTNPEQKDPQENADGLTEPENTDAKTIATGLYNDMKGISWNFIFARDPQPYKSLATASDRVTVGAYNYFNSNFASQGETLLTWLKGDTFISTGESGAAVNLIYEKFNRLNLI